MSSGLEKTLFWLLVVVLVGMHALAIRRRNHKQLLILGVMDAYVATIAYAGTRHTRVYEAWAREDAWVEWGTFFAFATAAVLAVKYLRAHWRDADELGVLWLGRVGFVGVAVVCVFVAGEELSWGQRLFAFRPPDVFLEHNFQQELNLHNFLKNKFDTKYQVALLAFVYGVCGPWVGRIPRVADTRWGHTLRCVAPSPWLCPWFFAVALAELAYPLELTGEIAELGLAWLFLIDGARRLWPSWRLVGAAPVAVLAVAVLMSSVVQPLIYGSEQEKAARALGELEDLRGDILLHPVVRTKLFTKSAIHKRLFTAVEVGYFRFADHSAFLQRKVSPAEDGERRDRLGYFLDPWNNAYWVHYRRRGGLILLYSFGPNRRRDTDTKRLLKQGNGKMLGDDIGVMLLVPRW